jgi:hypothetical protein
VADGTFAVLTLALGLFDMTQNHCPNEGCLAKNTVDSHLSFSAAETYFQEDPYGQEIYIRHDTSLAHGPFQTIYGLSVTDDQDVWFGVGHAYTMPLFHGAYMQLHAMPGVYFQGEGVDLGGPIEFRSGIELGYEARNGLRIGLGYDHRSNAGIYESNMGLETVMLRVSIPTN